jgi:hypothetical protein
MPPHNDRQKFLGLNHEDVLGRYRVAVVGIGGGGTHFSQQLLSRPSNSA